MSTIDTMASPLQILTKASEPPSLDKLTKLYTENFYWNLVYLIILTLVFILVLAYVFAGGYLADITNNWPKHRCNPMIMPFAGLFGYDATANFNFCMNNIFTLNAGTVLTPIYGLMSSFTDIAGTVANSANSFRYLIANLLNGMERLMNSYRDKFQGVLFALRMSFKKMLNLMGRLYGAFYAIIFMGLSGLKAAENVANNDLVKFLFEFCFDPETPVILEDGSVKSLKNIVIGDRLKIINGIVPVVTSVFRFNGHKTPMVRIGEILVSKEHFVLHDNTWIKAGDHPLSKAADSIPELICLNTTNHAFELNGLIFSDYDESDDIDVTIPTQKLAEKYLNSGLFDEPCDSTRSYELGLDPNMPIVFKNGSTRKLCTIQIGDVLIGESKVLGLVQEQCTYIVTLPNGFLVSGSQLIWDEGYNLWRRAGLVYPMQTVKLLKPIVLYQLTTSDNRIESLEYIFRDYREVNEPDMESLYASSKNEKN